MIDGGTGSSHLKWEAVPKLTNPIFVAGFHGWSNAGSVSSDTLEYLMESLKPQVFAKLSLEPFINFTLDRPIGQIEDGVIHDLEPLFTELLFWHNPRGEHDLIFLLGKEPHFGWQCYARIFVEIMTKLNATRLYTIGGVQDTVSHYATPVISVVASSPYMVATTAPLEEGVRSAEYYGPVSIHSYLIERCTGAGMEAISLWGHVPAYLQKSPRVVAKIVTILNKAAGLQCPLDDLHQKAMELDRKINEAVRKDPNLKRLIQTIERETQSASRSGSDEKVIRLNDFLHRGPHDDSQQ